MEYIVIPTKDKSETTFFLKLFKKLRKEVKVLSSKNKNDKALIAQFE